MNLQEHELETLLKHAPVPAVPPDLKHKLQQQFEPGSRGQRALDGEPQLFPAISSSWFRRWWPVLVPGAACLVCGVALALQNAELRDLHHTMDALRRAAAEPKEGPRLPSEFTPAANLMSEQEQELQRLRDTAAKLRHEIGGLEAILQENKKLRAKLAAQVTGLSEEEQTAVEQAREKAFSIQCVNNLKQLGLAAIVYATDHKDTFAPSIIAMAREISAPSILHCPADTARSEATDWQSFSSANCSYEFLTPDAAAYKEPSRVMFRCPIHGSITLGDGSVQSGVAKTHPEWLVETDGKLFMNPPTPAKTERPR